MFERHCKYCGREAAGTSCVCMDCSNSMVHIAPSWFYDSEGNVLEHDPGWYGPQHLLPARYRRVECLA